MKTELAISVKAILGSKPSDDGKFGLIGVQSGDFEIPLAFPKELLGGLAYAALIARAQCYEKSGNLPSLTGLQSLETFPCEWWQFGASPDGTSLTLSFRISGGGWAHFQVPRQWVAQMRETLEVIEGRASAPPPSTIRS